MGGQLDLTSEPGEGTTFFFTIELEEIETLNESSKGSFSNLKALVLTSEYKEKTQDDNLIKYLEYFGIKHTSFTNIAELHKPGIEDAYDFVFVDGPKYRSPHDGHPTFDFDYLHILRNSKIPVAGLIDQRVSTVFVLQQVLGKEKIGSSGNSVGNRIEI